MADTYLVEHALELMRDNEVYIEDSRRFAGVGNSVVGSLLAIQFSVPRQYTEASVREALRRLDAE